MNAINYQGPGAAVTAAVEGGVGTGELVVTARRKLPNGATEKIEVHFRSLQFTQSFPINDDAELKVFGSERQLSDLLMADLNLIEPGLKPIQKESGVRQGTIDILAEDFRGRLVVIEVKRRTAGLDAVTQLARYVEEMGRRKDRQTRGILVAPEVTPNALKMLERQGLEFFKLDYEVSNPSAKIKGLEKKQKMLGEF